MHDCPHEHQTTKSQQTLILSNNICSDNHLNMKPNTNIVQNPDQLPHPQGKKEDLQGISFRDRCARSIRYLRALSFNYLQGSEDLEHEAEESRGIFYDQIAVEDSEFEFASPASTPTRGNVLFCGRLIRQRQPMEQEQSNAKMRGLSASTNKFPYQTSPSNCSTSISGKQSRKTLIGMLSFKADMSMSMSMSMSEMKKRQKQRERVPLIPTTTAAGTDELESTVTAGSDGRCDRQKKMQMGLLRRMKPKGKLPGVLVKALAL